MGVLQLLASRNYISVNKDLIKLLGLEEAILLGELASEYNYWETQNELEDNYFYSTIENIEENTGLSAHKQRKAIKTLQDVNLIEIKLKGIPAKRYIKINEQQVIELFNNKMLKNLTTGCKKIEQLDTKKLNGNNNIINKNNNKNNKKNNNSSFDDLINQNFNNEELKDSIYEFIKMRKTIKKPLTERALLNIINKLYNMTNNEEEQIEIINESITNSWQGIYPLKKQTKERSNKGNFDDFKELYEEAIREDEQRGNYKNNNIVGW